MKNYILYDDTYLGPGFLIISKENEEVIKYLKIYTINSSNLPNFGLRVFSAYGRDTSEMEYNVIDFTFSKIDELYEIFHNLCINLDGNIVTTIDKFYQGRNHFYLNEENDVVTLSVAKDVYGFKGPRDFIDINIGDDVTCENYNAILSFYNTLVNANVKKANATDVRELLLTRLK